MDIIKKIIFNIFFQSVLFGLFITTVFILIWDAPIKKYNVEVEPYFAESAANQLHWFAGDFDGDGNSERIKCSYGQGSRRLDISYYNKDGLLVDQYHIFKSDWNHELKPAIYDIDGDKKSELLFFTERNDSIFFNAFTLSDASLTIDHLFFGEIELKRNDYSYRASFYDFGDYNKDGNMELYFWFDAGFGLYPRGIFKMEFPSLNIVASNSEYMAINPEFSYDITGDGIPELFTRCYAPSNTTRFQKYGDTVCYIAVFNSDLEFLFEPIAFPGEYGYVYCLPDLSNDSIFYAFFHSRANNQEPMSIYVLNKKGEILNEKQWTHLEHPESMSFQLLINNNSTYLYCSRMGIFKLDKNLSELPDKIEPANNWLEVPILSFDLNEDGSDELISIDSYRNLSIYDEKAKESVSVELPISISGKISVYPYYSNYKLVKYMIDTGAGFIYFRYEHNPYFFVLHLIYVLVFSLSTFALWLILFLQKRSIEKKWNTERQLSELQFNNVKNQLNPHFLFNSLNSVALMINEGKAEDAYDFLTVNSRMIQRVLDGAGQTTRSLKNEILFTKDFLNIQSRRFKGRFTTKIETSPEVDLNFEVPKMCIHTYVENAIKHGFRNTNSGGKLWIGITSEKHGVKIIIADNGMGRIAASRYKDSSGNGMRIMEEFYLLFEKYYGYKIQFSISDHDLGNTSATGTVVELTIVKNN